jgi:predicted ester cyclase
MKNHVIVHGSKNLAHRVIAVLLCSSGWMLACGQDISVLNSNKAAVIEYFDVVINDHNISRKAEFFQADYILHTMNGEAVHSSQDSMHNSLLRWLFAAIPNVHYKITHIVAGGEMVAVNTIATGTARSEMFGLPPAKGKVRYEQIFIYRLINGKIAEQWEVIDPDGIKAQLEQKK